MGKNSYPSGILYIGDPVLTEMRALRKYVPLDYSIDLAGTTIQVQAVLAQRQPALVVFGEAVNAERRAQMLETLVQSRQTAPCVFLSAASDLGEVAGILERGPGIRGRQAPAVLDDEMWGCLLESVVSAVDARDPRNLRHSQRVSETSEQLGRALGLPEAELQRLKLAALLHDIGKMRVPEEILSKPGKLDGAEWEIMRLHPVHGAEMVSCVEPMGGVAEIVRHHHERVDGLGYPDRLRGDEIPLLARLLSVADAYQAMTSDRAYRPAMPDAEARGLIQASLGTQFDPEIGGAFLGLVPA